MRSIPSYIFLLWRWTWWLYAFAWIMLGSQHQAFLYIFLGITFVQAVIATLYSPVFELLLPGTPSTWTTRSKKTRTRRRWLSRKAQPPGNP